MNLNRASELFKNPPIECRPVPFWFWNDHLDPRRLIWQYDHLVDAGMAGAVLHARGGLDPDEYLDQRWFSAVAAVVEHAKKRGTLIWLYDELGWPSGTAGGKIPQQNPQWRMIHLKLFDGNFHTIDDIQQQPGELVAAFVVTKSDPNHGIQRRNDGGISLVPDRIEVLPIPLPLNYENLHGERLFLFRKVALESVLNYLDPDATRAFIESTHEKYFQCFGEYFGTTITHSFMDEAGMFASIAELPWDHQFNEKFKARRGYSLMPNLPALFFDTPGCELVRFDYWSLVAELFREGFAIPMHQWCKSHGIHYTGHYVFETTLKEATRQLASTMPFYEYQGLPGIDILGNDFYSIRFEQEAYGKYVVNIKQASSVNHQLNKGGLMSESHGVGGRKMNPEEMQLVDQFQLALGVTKILQHAPFYSMRGRRKSDCPPIIGWQQPYWSFVRKHIDAISRIGWLLSRGRHVCDVLLLHPAASMQATYRHFRIRDEYKAEDYLFDADLPFELIDKHFTLLSVALLDAQIDFDYGDEEIIARHGLIQNAHFTIGEAAYRIVVLPPMVNLRSTTFRLLKQFSASGGIIFIIGSAPRLLDGKPSDEAIEFFDQHARQIREGIDLFDYSGAVDALTAADARSIRIADHNGADVPAIKVQRRKWEGSEILYLTNISREPVRIHLSCRVQVAGRLEEWDFGSGAITPVQVCESDKAVEFDLEMPAGSAKSFVARPGRVEIPAKRACKEKTRICSEWMGERDGPNMLLLDECQFEENGNISERMSISEAQAELAKLISSCDAPVRKTIRFPFSVGSIDSVDDSFELAIELGEDPELHLNGNELQIEPTGWILDPAIQKFSLPQLRSGTNWLTVRATFREATDLQSPWLLGEFSLTSFDNILFVVEKPSKRLPLGSWQNTGLPFYAGTVSYRASVNFEKIEPNCRTWLELPGLAGSAEIRVNGDIIDHVLWQPYTCEITASIRSGETLIEVVVANTLRNLLGPHFEPNEAVMPGFGDKSYQGAVGEAKLFKDYGLLAAPEIVIYG
ncbi:hypothetical protein JXJ21_20250 [candidate division KSB1 bacterium]|nr:hypothetical protein [candidate division KSB1 bacterium]